MSAASPSSKGCEGAYEQETGDDTLVGGVGAGIGAGLMYLLDPERGRRRRALIRERTGSVARDAQRAAGRVTRDLENRVQGQAAQARQRRQEPVNDDVLMARVRAKLGRLISHPHQVEVTARHGAVTLTGQVAPEETGRLISRIERVPGVKSVENRLNEASPAPAAP